ncbi:hypothetical protein Tsubulata_024485, partial [Turnera subulata]
GEAIMPVNITSIKTSSNGAWQGDNPLDFAFPLLIVQTILILVVSRFLAFLLKPLRQPKGGILLGPSAFGRNQEYMHRIFPKWSTPILESVASIGLLFFLFLVGLELDLSSIRRSGKRAFGIALAGISLPFLGGIGVAFVLRKTVDGADKVGFGQFLVFMGVALSITAFPVLARILAELKLLTTQVGETAMAAAAFNDVAAWILLALAVALAGNGDGGGQKSPLVSVWVLLCGAAFVIFMMVAIRPAMKWVASRCSSEHDVVDEAYICLTLAGVMVSGFMTDLIGIHSIFGAFVFGLTIPKGGQFAERLIERIEDFVSGLLLPLYFASSGLKTNVATIKGGKAWGLLVLVISTACAGKIIGTFVVALMFLIPVRESLALGFLMNTKGLVELIVLNIGKEKKVLNDETFAILVLMALFTTFITTPTVMAIYKPARGKASTRTHRKLGDLTTTKDTKDQLRILACAHGPGNVPSLISLVESTRSTKRSQLKLFIMHLVELTERTSSIIMAQRARKNGLPFFNRIRRHDRVSTAFRAYSQLGRVSVRPTTAISALATMHEDICQVAEAKRVAMIILPFHKRWWKGEEEEDAMENVGHEWRGVNQRVLKNAPCSVAVLVDRGFGNGPQTPGPNTTVTLRVCVIFFGGPDDREALELCGRMAEHPGVHVVVLRFIEKMGFQRNNVELRPSPSKDNDEEGGYSFSTATMNRDIEKASPQLNHSTYFAYCLLTSCGIVEHKEKVASNIVEGVLSVGQSGDYDLLIVGKGRFPSAMVAELADRQAEHGELGPIGDVLASSGNGVVSSVLVIQQHDLAHVNEAPALKVVHPDHSPASELGESAMDNGGILLGPSALGRNKDVFHLLFPAWSTPILESVASIGLLFFLFLVGLELDLSSIRQNGRRAFGIAAAGISLPFLIGIGVSFFLRKAVRGEDKVGYGQYLMFIGVALSITAFPVLARILAELKLLTTQIGQTAMAAAAFNDVAAWVLLALAVALSGNGPGGDAKSPLISIWIIISGAAFVAFMLVFIRPMMNWIAKKCSSEQDFVDEAYICLTLAGVMLSGFMTDLIGIHSIFGAFVFGLTIPKGGEFAARLTRRIEDFVSGLLLPLYFASSGLKTDVAQIRGLEAWALLLLVISTACAGKILGTFVVAMLCMIPVRESLALGVLMNTKGLVELIVLNIGKEKKVLNDEMFAILVLMALFTTFMTTPTVMAIYNPWQRRTSQTGHTSPNQQQIERQSSLNDSPEVEYPILACIHGPNNAQAVISLIESTRTATKLPMKAYVMHLVELTDRSSSIMMVQRARKNGSPFVNHFDQGTFDDRITAAFKAYGQINQVAIHHSTAISALSTMHEDICHIAKEKEVAMIILPFHKRWSKAGESIENSGHGWRGVNQMVLKTAPCSVAVLVDRGFGVSHQDVEPSITMQKKVCVLLLGEADDCEALELGGRMVEHQANVTVIKIKEKPVSGYKTSSSNYIGNKNGFSTTPSDDGNKEPDDPALEEYKRKWRGRVDYIEKEVSDIVEAVLGIAQSTQFNLLIAGKRAKLAKKVDHQAEHPELGVIGDILASSDHGIVPSVLVIQKHNSTTHDEGNMYKVARDNKGKGINAMIKGGESSV